MGKILAVNTFNEKIIILMFIWKKPAMLWFYALNLKNFKKPCLF